MEEVRISDLPDHIKVLALQNQKEADGEGGLWDKSDNAAVVNAFNFTETPEGFEFWSNIRDGKFHEPAQVKKIVRRFPSGAVRSDDRGRIRPDYISPYALEEIAKHFTANEKEFGSDEDATNYFKGIRPVDVKGSIGRHYIELMQSFAENNEEDIRLNLRAMAANCIMALHQIAIEEKGLYKEPYEKTEYIIKD